MLVKCKDAARELGVTPRTLARYRNDGKIDAALVTAGGHARYEEKDIEEFRQWLVKNATSRGSSGARTASPTPAGTTTESGEPSAKASTPVSPKRPPYVSDAFSSKAPGAPGLKEMLD